MSDIRVINIDTPDYPKKLIEVIGKTAPKKIYCKGNYDLLGKKSVAIVGSRNIHPEDFIIIENLVDQLVKNGYCITSGYAKGVDITAHKRALENNGFTIAVLSEGMSYQSIKKEVTGLVNDSNILFVSQFEPDQVWKAGLAMARNKIVVGLSDALIVIASGEKRDSNGRMSGTFNAAEYALKSGIPVIVVSNSILKEKHRGNDDLIKLGALESINTDDIVDMLKKNKFKKKPEQSTLL